MKKIILVAGGTGGHFFAAKAIGEELITRGHDVHIITDLRCQKYIPNSDSKLIFHIIDLKRYPKSSLQKIKFFIALSGSVLKSVKLLYNLKPNVVVGFGGYPVVSSLFASIWLRIPIIIHEQNSYLGKVNKFFAKFAIKIVLAYQETKNLPDILKNKIVITGGVVRADIRNILLMNKECHSLKGRNLEKLSLDPCLRGDDIKEGGNDIKRNGRDLKGNGEGIKRSRENIFRIFIFGGSQGAKIFSELLPRTIKLLMKKQPKLELHITQQVTDDDQVKIKKIYSELNISYQLSEFFDDIAHQYQNTDLVISRAGASTIEELTYIGLPAIFIPLPTAADNHQYYNAKLLEDAGAGWCMEQSDISEEKLADKILLLIKNPNMLEQATKNLLKRKKESHKILSDVVADVVNL